LRSGATATAIQTHIKTASVCKIPRSFHCCFAMAASTTPRKQVKTFMFLAMIAFGQVDAASRKTAAAGIATLALAAHGARDDGTRAISVHGAGHQVLADSRTREANELLHAYNRSLMEARTGCGLPSTNQGWLRMTIGKVNAYGTGVPFVGIVLSAASCAEAVASRCKAGQLLKQMNNNNDDQFDQMDIQDVAILQCQKSKANRDVFNGCVLGFALSVGSTIACAGTAGVSACVTTPLGAAIDATTAIAACWEEENSCGFTSVDPRAEDDDMGLVSGKKKGRLTKFAQWLTRCASQMAAAVKGKK